MLCKALWDKTSIVLIMHYLIRKKKKHRKKKDYECGDYNTFKSNLTNIY